MALLHIVKNTIISPQEKILALQEALTFDIFVLRCEEVPETQGFVSSTRNNGTSVRTHREVENPTGVASQGGHFGHGGAFPEVNLIELIPVSAYQFVRYFAEHQAADLRARLHHLSSAAGKRISKPYRPVRSPTTRHQHSVLVW